MSMTLVGSGYYSYWFSVKNLIVEQCLCGIVVKTTDVCRDDYGDYSIQCPKCEDYIEIWKDEDE